MFNLPQPPFLNSWSKYWKSLNEDNNRPRVDSTRYIAFKYWRSNLFLKYLRNRPEKKEDLSSTFAGTIASTFVKGLCTTQHWNKMPHKLVGNCPLLNIHKKWLDDHLSKLSLKEFLKKVWATSFNSRNLVFLERSHTLYRTFAVGGLIKSCLQWLWCD